MKAGSYLFTTTDSIIHLYRIKRNTPFYEKGLDLVPNENPESTIYTYFAKQDTKRNEKSYQQNRALVKKAIKLHRVK